MPETAYLYREGPQSFKHNSISITHEGALITLQHLVAFLSNHNQLTNWHGAFLGTWEIHKTWRDRHGRTMHQIYAEIPYHHHFLHYTGRSQADLGSCFYARRIRSELRSETREEA